MEWYAVQNRPHQEDKAAQNLRRLGLETLSPYVADERVVHRRLQRVTAPLFPGYVFARFGLEEHLRPLSYARGVRRVVAFGAVPASVDPAIIGAIRSRLDDGRLVARGSAFVPGQPVRIVDGPFEGFNAMFERRLSDRERVVLLLRTLAMSARVVVPAASIAAL